VQKGKAAAQKDAFLLAETGSSLQQPIKGRRGSVFNQRLKSRILRKSLGARTGVGFFKRRKRVKNGCFSG
jgi:hypothetical protein